MIEGFDRVMEVLCDKCEQSYIASKIFFKKGRFGLIKFEKIEDDIIVEIRRNSDLSLKCEYILKGKNVSFNEDDYKLCLYDSIGFQTSEFYMEKKL